MFLGLLRPAWALFALVALSFGLTAQDVKKEARQESAPGRSLGVASVPNLRDLGGYPAKGGFIVRKGLLFRSNQLNRISESDLKKIAALGLKNDYDLRTADERKRRPDELPPGVKDVSLDVLGESEQNGGAELSKLLQNPTGDAGLALKTTEAVYAKLNRDLVTLPSAKKAYRQLFLELGDEANLPALVHCTSGKDRTGWAAAALLALLGVSEETILEDYLRSNDYVLPPYQRNIDAFAKAGGDPAVVRGILGVRKEYLQAAFAEMKQKHGSIEGYFEQALGIDAAGQKALRERFLVRP